MRKPRRAEKRARGNRASRAAEDAYRTGQAGGVGGGERGGPREAIEAGSEWGASARAAHTEGARGYDVGDRTGGSRRLSPVKEHGMNKMCQQININCDDEMQTCSCMIPPGNLS